MRVYVAGPWVDREEVKKVAADLEAVGFSITHPWWDHEGSYDDYPLMREYAEKDFYGVMTAEKVVVCDFSKSEGKAVEQGIAIAAGIPIVLLRKEGVNNLNIFHTLPNYTIVHSVNEVINALRG